MNPDRSNIERILNQLAREEAQVVLVGDLAAKLHGVPHLTNAIDLCYAATEENQRRLVRALAPLHPHLRADGLTEEEARPLPWHWDERALRGSPDLTLQTDAGPLGLLANIPGVGDFAQVAAAAVDIEVFGLQVPTLDLPALIASKRAAGRLKDQLALPQMEATLRLRNLEQPRHLLDDDRGSNEQRDP